MRNHLHHIFPGHKKVSRGCVRRMAERRAEASATHGLPRLTRCGGPWSIVTYWDAFGEGAYFAPIPSKFVKPDGSFVLFYSGGWGGPTPMPRALCKRIHSKIIPAHNTRFVLRNFSWKCERKCWRTRTHRETRLARSSLGFLYLEALEPPGLPHCLYVFCSRNLQGDMQWAAEKMNSSQIVEALHRLGAR